MSSPPLIRREELSFANGMVAMNILEARTPDYVRNPPIEAVVFAWGVSEDRQLGLDTDENVKSPKVVEALLGMQFRGREMYCTPLIGGSRNTLAIDASGQLWSWGWNARGTLGHGHRGPERKPKPIQALRDVSVIQAAIGGWHCLALTDSGQVYAWGGNEYMQCGVEPDKRDIVTPTPCVPFLRVTQVACGGMHSLVLTDTGDMWTWGEPWGDFSLDMQREPRKVPCGGQIMSIACGAFHNIAVDVDGRVCTWGTNDYGQLGNGSTCYQTTPERVVDLDGVTVASVAAGGWHSLALTTDGDLFIWGRGEYGRLGLGDRSGSSKLRPHKVRGLDTHVVVQASCGGTHTVALTLAGRAFIWGRGSFGRLGHGLEKDLYHPMEVPLPGGHERWRVVAVACGGRHSLLLALPVRDTGSARASVTDDAAHVRRSATAIDDDLDARDDEQADVTVAQHPEAAPVDSMHEAELLQRIDRLHQEAAQVAQMQEYQADDVADEEAEDLEAVPAAVRVSPLPGMVVRGDSVSDAASPAEPLSMQTPPHLYEEANGYNSHAALHTQAHIN